MWFNTLMKPLLRSPLHRLMSHSIMLMCYRGRKSGSLYTIPVNYVRDCQTLWTISTRERTWWRNLRGGAPVTLHLKGKDVAATGQAIEDPAEVAEKLMIYLELVPHYAKFFGVTLDAENQPKLEEVEKAAQSRVMVRFDLA